MVVALRDDLRLGRREAGIDGLRMEEVEGFRERRGAELKGRIDIPIVNANATHGGVCSLHCCRRPQSIIETLACRAAVECLPVGTRLTKDLDIYVGKRRRVRTAPIPAYRQWRGQHDKADSRRVSPHAATLSGLR
jgi:hypothetical protein